MKAITANNSELIFRLIVYSFFSPSKYNVSLLSGVRYLKRYSGQSRFNYVEFSFCKIQIHCELFVSKSEKSESAVARGWKMNLK